MRSEVYLEMPKKKEMVICEPCGYLAVKVWKHHCMAHEEHLNLVMENIGHLGR